MASPDAIPTAVVGLTTHPSIAAGHPHDAPYHHRASPPLPPPRHYYHHHYFYVHHQPSQGGSDDNADRGGEQQQQQQQHPPRLLENHSAIRQEAYNIPVAIASTTAMAAFAASGDPRHRPDQMVNCYHHNHSDHGIAVHCSSASNVLPHPGDAAFAAAAASVPPHRRGSSTALIQRRRSADAAAPSGGIVDGSPPPPSAALRAASFFGCVHTTFAMGKLISRLVGAVIQLGCVRLRRWASRVRLVWLAIALALILWTASHGVLPLGSELSTNTSESTADRSLCSAADVDRFRSIVSELLDRRRRPAPPSYDRTAAASSIPDGRTFPSQPSGLSRPVVDPEVETTCVPPWDVPLPSFLDAADQLAWLGLEQPYGGCTTDHMTPQRSRDVATFVAKTDEGQARQRPSSWRSTKYRHVAVAGATTSTPNAKEDNEVPAPAQMCTFEGGCSNYQVSHNASVRWDSLGNCGGHPKLAVDEWADGAQCDPRTFIPLRIPQGLYFGHLVNVMTKLVRVFDHGDNVNAVVYMEQDDYVSPSSVEILNRLGLSLIHTFPDGVCFRKVVWVCHTVSYDMDAPRRISTLLRRAYDDVDSAKALRTATGERCTKVYASRWEAANVQNGRPMVNEGALVAHLRAAGWCAMFGNETMAQWAATLRQATIFAGPHGGAMVHQFWLDPANEPAVIELDGYRKYTVEWLHAVTLGHRYGWMSFSPTSGVAIDRFDQLVAHVSKRTRAKQ